MAIITGTAAADSLAGTSVADQISDLGGDASIQAVGGNDVAKGNEGGDFVSVQASAGIESIVGKGTASATFGTTTP